MNVSTLNLKQVSGSECLLSFSSKLFKSFCLILSLSLLFLSVIIVILSAEKNPPTLLVGSVEKAGRGGEGKHD